MNTGPRVLGFPRSGANAYLDLLTGNLEAAGAVVDDFTFRRAILNRYDAVHIHWPDAHLRTNSWWRAIGKHARLAFVCAILRLRRTRIVWTLHNLESHERDHWISRTLFPLWFPRLCTHVIALSPAGLELARRRYPPLRHKAAAVVPHGHYRNAYPPAPAQPVCRHRLGLAPRSPTLLFFGSIRRYKNVPHLIDVFRQLSARDVQLVVAGQPVVGMRGEDLVLRTGGDPRIHLHLRFIPDDEVSTFMGAADLVVLPFTGVLNSGSVLLALSFNRPVLTPRIGALPELQRAVGERWLQLYDGPLTPAVLARAHVLSTTSGCRGGEVDLSSFDWQRITADTLEVYRSPAVARRASQPAPGRAGRPSPHPLERLSPR
jgi:glycosyltransferase involved in cell wall biosynthesis